jgi:GntR family transcriptional regulator, rspAB operon transcriptional repressor
MSVLKSGQREGSTVESLSEHAYQLIREKILRGKYPLGAALSRRQLAKELRMSFLPISEALQHLEIDGLVESRPRVGTRVRIPTLQGIRERYVLREALESQAARLFAQTTDENGKSEICNMGRQLDQLHASSGGADDDFLYSVNSYHMRFHLRIAEIGGNSLLRDAIEREQVLIFNWLFDTAAQQRTLPANFHAELAAALASGSLEVADVAMRSHVRYGLDYVLDALRPFTNGNEWRVPRNGSSRGVLISK